MQILIIEDEKRLADFLQKGLSSEGYTCRLAYDGETGLEMALNGNDDVIILDRMLPRKDGLAVLHELRQQRPEVRVLMLTALAETDDKILGLRTGADDYLGKPFDFEELLARIDALGRRGSNGNSTSQQLLAGNLCLDLQAYTAQVAEKPLELTQIEFELLRLFLQNPTHALSRERILNRVWGDSKDPLTNIVDVYIRRLRVKLEDAEATIKIDTVRGVGYRLNQTQSVA
ncbi:response regulator transcription factor [Pseudidiomarina taiwanensis]|uniref:DNA-binding response regulator n=1 Tax=Pseudidiomarina taiwanensis TaxID=337250 RepID=A0A432ZFK0_9GAMM|nr:response regulator transcription factor [Pseudidiomarina taiwanensis]RUO76746.1 DNA-binding response regulator [Pseudidiomarina taiwanensis]